MYKAVFVIISLMLFFSSSAETSANTAGAPYESSAPIAYMVDMSSGTILFDKGSDRKIPPASMTKMMSAYVIFDLVKSGKLSLERKITISPDIWKNWNNRGSTMFLSLGETVSVKNLLHGMVTVSGNDASIALAEGIYGSEEAFVAKMNETARRIGMENSHFGTVNGWPDEGRTLVTARDLALLANRTITDHPQLYSQFYGTENFTWGGVTQADRNPILGKVPGADGLKTGHTQEAGYCFTGSAIQNGRRLILVVAGLDSNMSRIQESTDLMKWGFAAWTSQLLFKKKAKIADIPVQLGEDNHLEIKAMDNMTITIPRGKAAGYKLYVRYKGPLKAPITKGSKVAELVIKFADGSEQARPLFSPVNVPQAGFFGRAWNGFKSVFGA